MKENVVRFLTSIPGRVLRILLGILILNVGLFLVPGILGQAVAVLALMPIAGGLFNFCLLKTVLAHHGA